MPRCFTLRTISNNTAYGLVHFLKIIQTSCKLSIIYIYIYIYIYIVIQLSYDSVHLESCDEVYKQIFARNVKLKCSMAKNAKLIIKS